MDLGLNGQVALVVGGTGLVGRAVVRRLRAEGAIVVAAARHAAPEDGAPEDGDDHTLIVDAGDDASVAAAVEEVLGRHGRIDALVVAAAPPAQSLDPDRHADVEQVRTAFEGKTLTFLRLADAVIPVMKRAGYGRIVGISGQNAFLTGSVAGSVRNAALIITAKNLADGLAGSGVTVNAVSPATVTAEPASEVAAGRGGESSPDQIADLVTFLVSPRAAAISGESIAVGHRVRGVTAL